MTIDRPRVIQLISELRQAVANLAELSALPDEEFLSNKHLVASAKYNLIIAAEAAIDLSNHAISRLGLRAPEDYADSFRVLAEQGAFSPDLLGRLISMARFRNRLVHFYAKIDDETIASILRSDLADFDDFVRAFGKFVGL